MTDQIETANEALPTVHEIKVEGIAAYAVFALATYGAQDLARKGVAKTKQIRADRKAKKAAKKAESNTPKQ